MTETYNADALYVDGQLVPVGAVSVGVDFGSGDAETSVAVLERGNDRWELKFIGPISRNEARSLERLLRRPLCWKCHDGRTRAHHRRCSKRGGKPQRFLAAYQAEALAAFRGRPSPRRLKGLTQASAMFLGERAAMSMRESERILDRFRPDRASASDLRELAEMYGVQ
jgi:hypothetical protein